MFRYLTQFQSIKTFSKQVEALKKNKNIVKNKQAQTSQLIEQQRLNKVYLQFQALRTDPLNIIRQRFIRKKKLLSNRRLYMPNKSAYMQQLDSYMKQIQLNHSQQIIRQTYSLPRTIGEKIQMQLQNQKWKFIFSLVRQDKWVIRISIGLITLLTIFEMLYCTFP